jgi:hypothetical protein
MFNAKRIERFELHCFRKMLRKHAFIFPAMLGFMRWFEPMLEALPLGAQYLLVGQKN